MTKHQFRRSTAIVLTAAVLGLSGVFAGGVSAQEKTVMVGGAPMYPSKNIVENAVNSKDHTTLVAAVKAAGLVDTLSGAGPFTVFAPTNEAFAKLPAGTVDTLREAGEQGHPDQDPHLSRRPRQGDGGRSEEDGQGRNGKAMLKTVEGEHPDGRNARAAARDRRCQGRHGDRDDRRRHAVERRDPRRRHRAHPGLSAQKRLDEYPWAGPKGSVHNSASRSIY